MQMYYSIWGERKDNRQSSCCLLYYMGALLETNCNCYDERGVFENAKSEYFGYNCKNVPFFYSD